MHNSMRAIENERRGHSRHAPAGYKGSRLPMIVWVRWAQSAAGGRTPVSARYVCRCLGFIDKVEFFGIEAELASN
jgi:hypothetical protein